MDWRKGVARSCLCIVMIGAGGEIVRLASPLCDWHWTACGEGPESPTHVTEANTLTTSSG